MGNHSSLRRRPTDLSQVLAGVLAVLLVVGTGVVLTLLLSDREIPPSRVTAPPTVPGTTPAAVPATVGDEERDAALSFAATAATQIVSTRYDDLDAETAAATDLMTPRYARTYRRTIDDLARDGAAGTLVEAEVVGTGLMGIAPDVADVLVFVDQTSTQGSADPVATAARFVVRLSRFRGEWRVDDLVPSAEPADHVAEPDPQRRDLIAAASEAAGDHVGEPAEVLAAGLARYDADRATVLVATSAEADAGRLRVAMRLVDGDWRATVSGLEPLSDD